VRALELECACCMLRALLLALRCIRIRIRHAALCLESLCLEQF
jgi:hypothetical protein